MKCIPAVSVDEFFDSYTSWAQKNMHSWDIISELRIAEELRNLEARENDALIQLCHDIDPDLASRLQPDKPLIQLAVWVCSNCNTDNSVGKSKCKFCNTKGKGWECVGCKFKNKVGEVFCVACQCSHVRSRAVLLIKENRPPSSIALGLSDRISQQLQSVGSRRQVLTCFLY